MNRFTRSLVLFAYLFVSLGSILGEGLCGFPTTVTITEGKSSPRTQYITSAGIPKHIVPSQFHQPDAVAVSGYREPEECITFVVAPDADIRAEENPNISGISGRAPPAI